MEGHGEVLGGVDAEAVDPEVGGGGCGDGRFVGCFRVLDVGDFEFDGDAFVVWEDLAAVFPGDGLAEGDGEESRVLHVFGQIEFEHGELEGLDHGFDAE